MCIRDSRADTTVPATARPRTAAGAVRRGPCAAGHVHLFAACLLYTSDAADERSSVDLGGRRIIKKKNTQRPRTDALHMQAVTYTQYTE